MIYSGIEIGIFFEVGFHIEECKDGLVLIRPFLQMVFVFVQMYFIFLNHKVMNEHPHTHCVTLKNQLYQLVKPVPLEIHVPLRTDAHDRDQPVRLVQRAHH